MQQLPWRNRRVGVVVRASASQSVDLRFNFLVKSYQKTLNNGICSFHAWRSAFRGGCGEQAVKFVRANHLKQGWPTVAHCRFKMKIFFGDHI